MQAVQAFNTVYKLDASVVDTPSIVLLSIYVNVCGDTCGDTLQPRAPTWLIRVALHRAWAGAARNCRRPGWHQKLVLELVLENSAEKCQFIILIL